MINNCPKCNGTGRIPNPYYPDRVRILDSRLERGVLPYPYYERELERIFGSLENIPEEYLECPKCHDSGNRTDRREGVYYGA